MFSFNHTSARHVPHVPRKLANANTLGRNCCSASPKVFTHQPLTERSALRYLPLRMCCESRIHLRRRVVAHRSELCCSEALANYFSFAVAKKLEKDCNGRFVPHTTGGVFSLVVYLLPNWTVLATMDEEHPRPSWSHQRRACGDDAETPVTISFFVPGDILFPVVPRVQAQT